MTIPFVANLRDFRTATKMQLYISSKQSKEKKK